MSKKCKCGQNITCRNCSQLKMVVLIDHKCPEYKIKGADGKLYNPVWYSYLKHNGRSNHFIIKGMLRRLQEQPMARGVNQIQFFENASTSSAPIQTIKA